MCLATMVDDLNDYNEDLMGHPQVLTPNIKKFSETALSFTNAYSNDPMCGPSRASMFTGVYPHISSHLWQYNWKNNEVLKNTKTIMEKFKENDNRTNKILENVGMLVPTLYRSQPNVRYEPFGMTPALWGLRASKSVRDVGVM